MNKKFIAIEGNIGSGKTSLASLMAKRFDSGLILEQFKENDFLQHFYEEPERHALPMELWFMAERYKQMEDYLSKGHLFHSAVISDYIFPKTLLFAQQNLNEREFRLFTRLFQMLEIQLPQPELIIFLYRPVKQLLQQIKERGRSYEQNIQPEYLNGIQEQYDQYFRNYCEVPVLYLDLGTFDLLGTPEAIDDIVELIEAPLEDGIRYAQIPMQ
ncbi:MAG TPA: deoxynucleoside kinase [Saprospiraceae bacterium]|nr:deoxynucleoside kinase [Saprospiraceae bacterium]